MDKPRKRELEPVVHVSRGFEEAGAWDVAQQVSMTPRERMRAARVLKDRAFPADSPDVRACHRTE